MQTTKSLEINNALTVEQVSSWSILFDKVLAITGVFFATGGADTVLLAMGFPAISVTFSRYLLPSVIFLRLAARPKATIKTLQSDPFLFCFHIIVFSSFLWSIQPDVTITNLRAEYIQGVMIALFLATRFTLSQQVRLIAAGIGISAILSFLFVGLFPSIAIHQDGHQGAWRGVLGNKNYFSSVMSLGVVSFFVLALNPRERRLWHLAGLALCVFLVLMSTSKTGQVLMGIVLVSVLLYRRFRWRGMRTVLILYLSIFTASALIYTLVTAWNEIFAAIGRDGTLTGRTLIWARLTGEYIPEKLFIGYGKGAFWSADIFSGLHFIPSHGHNGLLDLMLDVGLVGLVLFLGSFILGWYRVFQIGYLPNRSSDLWPLALFTAFSINNITESLLLYQSTIFWVLYMATCWALKEELTSQQGYPEQTHRYAALESE